MTLERAQLYTSDGRLRGSYVTMVLWQIEEPILVKLGRSVTPLACLEQWIDARVISVLEVASVRAAVRLQSELAAALAQWNSCFDWFTVLPRERGAFNAALRPVIEAHSSPSRRIRWNNYSIPTLLHAAQERRLAQQKTFMRRPSHYRDFGPG